MLKIFRFFCKILVNVFHKCSKLRILKVLQFSRVFDSIINKKTWSINNYMIIMRAILQAILQKFEKGLFKDIKSCKFKILWDKLFGDPNLLSRIFTKRYTMSGIVNCIKEPTLVNTHTYKNLCTLVTSWNVQPILILKDTLPESGTAVGYYVEAPFSILGAAESPVARGMYMYNREATSNTTFIN